MLTQPSKNGNRFREATRNFFFIASDLHFLNFTGKFKPSIHQGTRARMRATFKREISDRRVGERSGHIVFLIFLILSIFLLPTANAATVDEKLVGKFVGKSWVNGRSWEKLDYAGKLGFVCGLFDGLTLFWSAAEAGKRADLDSVYHSLSVPTSLTVGDIVKGIDDFYSDAENARLPAICAYLYFAFKSRGESGESLDKRLMLWRKMFNR
jgi:hypothetical protein